MTRADPLTDVPIRDRTLDLAYCLYECLSDLIDDLTYIESSSDDIDWDGMRERVRIAAINCMGDIEPLTPILRRLARMDNGSDPC